MLQDSLEDISVLVKKGLTETLDFIINADIDPKLENSSLLKNQKGMKEKKGYLVASCMDTEQLMNSNTVSNMVYFITYFFHCKIVKVYLHLV